MAVDGAGADIHNVMIICKARPKNVRNERKTLRISAALFAATLRVFYFLLDNLLTSKYNGARG